MEAKQLDLATKKRNSLVSQTPLHSSEKAALRKAATPAFPVNAMQSRTTVFPDLYRLVFRGNDRRQRARDRYDLLRALDDITRAMGRIEEVQNRRQPLVAVQLLEDEERLKAENSDGQDLDKNEQ